LNTKRLRLSYGVGVISKIDKLYVTFAKEPYERDDILQKRPIILSILLSEATPYLYIKKREPIGLSHE